MRLEVGRVDHDGAAFALPTGQAFHHPDEDTRVAPSLPAVVEGLVWPVGRWGVPPAQTVAIDEDDPTQHPAVIHRGTPWLLGK